MNKAIFTGYLASDPEARATQGGIPVTTFRIAVQRRFANSDGKREADFFNVVTWRGLAETCAKYLSKGRRVLVSGEMQNRSYDGSDGMKRYICELIADGVEFLDSGKNRDGGADGFVPVADEDMPF